MDACVCCVEGEAAAEDDDSEDVGGWGVEEEAEEVEAAVVAADDEVSTMLLCVMKRSRNFMAGRRVMMIFSTLRKRDREKTEMLKARTTHNDRQRCSDNKESKLGRERDWIGLGKTTKWNQRGSVLFFKFKPVQQ